uniref:Ion_trans_2 domain-containing protein n=1 Tax=Rhabditophanes sp. KR3021 TaxID=114890 RepID=A0AC35U6K6_9BILA
METDPTKQFKKVWPVIFRLSLLALFLTIGTGMFYYLINPIQRPYDEIIHKKIDTERIELLNVLWAESLARSEHEWSRLSNQKLDNYENVLKSIYKDFNDDIDENTVETSMNQAYSLFTTLENYAVPYESPIACFGIILYSIFGITLFISYLDAFNKLFDTYQITFAQRVGIFFGNLFVYSILLEMKDEEKEKLSFSNTLLETFLLSASISAPPDPFVCCLLILLQLLSTSLFAAMILSAVENVQFIFERYEILLSQLNGVTDLVKCLKLMLQGCLERLMGILFGEDYSIKDKETLKKGDFKVTVNKNTIDGKDGILERAANGTSSAFHSKKWNHLTEEEDDE